MSGSGPAGARFEGLRAPVVVGCSGGPDSLALLVLAVRHRLAPIAVHVDHGLRPDSAGEADVVGDAARGLGASFRSCRVDVPAGGNLEARARAARYGALEAVRAEEHATAVLVGHTADDQAETMLLNLLRGAGSAGMAGMPARRGHVVRPLLGVRRAALATLCRACGLTPIDDPTNRDFSYRRSWVRHEVMPRLEAGAARDLVPVLTRQAALLRDESDLLDALAGELLDAAGPSTPATAALAAAPVALARRAVRRWLGVPPPSAAEVERVLAVVRHERRATELAGGRRVTRSGGRLALTGAAPSARLGPDRSPASHGALPSLP